jgi:hypothetical protein
MIKDKLVLSIKGEELERYIRDNLRFTSIIKEIKDKVRD